jgi:hypothetical protein
MGKKIIPVNPFQVDPNTLINKSIITSYFSAQNPDTKDINVKIEPVV